METNSRKRFRMKNTVGMKNSNRTFHRYEIKLV